MVIGFNINVIFLRNINLYVSLLHVLITKIVKKKKNYDFFQLYPLEFECVFLFKQKF